MPRYSPAGSLDGLACLLAFALDLLLKGLCLSPVHSFISRSFFFFFLSSQVLILGLISVPFLAIPIGLITPVLVYLLFCRSLVNVC